MIASAAERYRLAWLSARRRARRFDDLSDELDERATHHHGMYEQAQALAVRLEGERDEARAELVQLGRELESWKLAFGPDALQQATDRLRAALTDAEVEERIEKIKASARERVASQQLREALEEERIEGKRPSVHSPMTKSYAIDQITDIERLRAVTHRMWEAFAACHEQSAHIIGALVGDGGCSTCATALFEEGQPCDRYAAWQKKITDGFGMV